MKSGLLFGAAGSAAVALRDLGIQVLFNYETRGDFYLKTFKNNFKSAVSTEELKEIRKIFNTNVIDLVVGQPDCKIYSNLRTRKKEKVKFKDTQLWGFLWLIQFLRPKIFIVENLSLGIEKAYEYLMTEAKFDYDFYEDWYGQPIESSSLLPNQFHLSAVTINAKSFLPQSRKRSFLVGLSKYYFPDKDKFYEFFKTPKDTCTDTVRDLIDDLKQDSKIPNHKIPNHSPERIKKFSQLKIGESYYGTQNNKKIDPDGIAPTITSHCTQYVHYKYPRVLTCRENARLMGWPDSFVFWGNKTQCLDQVGKAIVIPVLKYLVQEIFRYLGVNNG